MPVRPKYNLHSIAQQMSLIPKGNIRHTSAVLSTFPWSTDFLLHEFDASGDFVVFRDFSQTLRRLEDLISPQTLDADVAELQKALAQVGPEPLTMPPAPRLIRPLPFVLCNLLCAYRLWDVLYALQRNASNYSNPRYHKLNVSVVPTSKDWPLQDWVSLLRNAKHSLERLENFRSRHESTSTAVVPATSIQVKLFMDLYDIWTHTSATKMLFNMQVAALHLSFMLKGSGPNDKIPIPNLPDGILIFQDAIKADSANIPTDSTFLTEFIAKTDLYKLRHPLYGALLFSPLYLLSDKKLTGNAWDQGNMILLSKALGNAKPSLLLRIEHKLWRVLLDVAMGKATLLTASLDFLSGLPWEELDMVSDTDTMFFCEDQSLPQEDIDILSVKGESSLSPSWPLAGLRPQGDSMNLDSSQYDSEEPAKPVELTDQGTEFETESVEASTAEQKLPRKRAPPAPDQEPKRSQRLVGKGRVAALATKTKGTIKRTQKRVVPLNTFVTFREVQNGEFLQKIRVDDFDDKSKITFNQGPRTRVKGQEVEIFNAKGQVHRWEPEFHFQSDLDKFMELHHYVEECYMQGKPRHISDKGSTHIMVMTFEEYEGKTVQQFQNIISKHHVVITGMPTAPLNFGGEGLQELTNLNAKIEFQDQSIEIEEGHFSPQLCTGTLDHILSNAYNPDGAIINGLSFPLPLSSVEKSSFSSDIEAWRLTEGLRFSSNKAVYPTSSMRWGLGSTAGARHWIHIDSDGLGTWVDVRCGGKWWLIFTPRDEDPEAFASVNEFDNFDVMKVNKRWMVEAVYLTPRTRLIMKPNTPHAVFTKEHSIVLGGHFYSFGNLQDTVWGIIHCFAADALVTNTEHPQTRVLLLRMMQYIYQFYVEGSDPLKNYASHLPNLCAPESLLDILSLCNYCILANVLDCRTYSFPGISIHDEASKQQLRKRAQYDYNALSPLDRSHISYVRGLAKNFLSWFSCHYTIAIPDVDCSFEKAIGTCYLISQAEAILLYKRKAEKEGVEGLVNCTAADVRRQLELLWEKDMELFGYPNLKEGQSQATRLGFDISVMKVTQRVDPLPFKEVDPLKYGITTGDQMFRRGSKRGFPDSNKNDNDEDEDGHDHEDDHEEHEQDDD